MTHSLSSDAAWQVRIGGIVAPRWLQGYFFQEAFFAAFHPPAAPYGRPPGLPRHVASPPNEISDGSIFFFVAVCCAAHRP